MRTSYFVKELFFNCSESLLISFEYFECFPNIFFTNLSNSPNLNEFVVSL